MCVVIDTCCLSRVFEKENAEHSHFASVLTWVTAPSKGSIVYGGSKYQAELEEARKFIKFINQLRTAGRAIRLDDAKVDKIAREVRKQINDRAFNDEHLVAIIIASRCCVICTCDKTAMPFLRNVAIYRKYQVKRPKIYSGKANKSLCSDKHITGICRGPR